MTRLKNSLRERLKRETKPSHLKLDDIVNELAPFSTAEKYRIYLKSLWQLYSIYGEAIDWASLRSGIQPTVHDLRHSIERDIEVEPDSLELDCLEYHNTRPRPITDSEASKWAAAYVMEGSAMGARMIVKQIERKNSLVDDSQTKYLVAPDGTGSSYLLKLANDSYERWPAFVEALGNTKCEEDLVVESAKSVFCVAQDIFAVAICNDSLP